ncbi:MAG: hypothetical protein Q9M31_01425 [Mariprofundus sp.]|nr:hypothetical protein [Mariprofundus sp.]
MDTWFEIVIRQLILYSLPVLISLSCVAMVELKLTHTPLSQPFSAMNSRAVWLPLLASISFHRGVIICMNRAMVVGVRGAFIRLCVHLLLMLLGLLLYFLSLSHMSPSGLPPLHHWWAKVLMFFNLCMVCMHLLPLPGQLLGEWLWQKRSRGWLEMLFLQRNGWLLLTLLAASPLIDLLLGANIIFPLYEGMANSVANLS